MSEKQKKRFPVKKIKHDFFTTGCILILYALFVRWVPYIGKKYLEITGISDLYTLDIYFYVFFIILIIGTLAPFFICRVLLRVKLKDVIKPAKISFPEMAIRTVIIFSFVSVVIFVITAIFNTLQLTPNIVSCIGIVLDENYLDNYLYIFAYIFALPIIEEYAFRGVLLRGLSKYGKRFALIASSVIFAIAHSSFSEMIPAFVMSIMLGKIALKFKSIQPTIFIHIIFNGMFYLMMITPSFLSKYLWILLFIIYVMAFVLILLKKYRDIRIKDSGNTVNCNMLFFTSFPVILAILLFIANSILMIFE